MLPKQISDLIQNFVRVYNSEHPAETEFRNAHQKFAESLVRRGFGWPSGAFNGIGRSVIQYLETKADFVWEKLQHVVTSTEIEPYPELSADLKSEIAKHLGPSVETAERYLDNLRQATNAPLGAPKEMKKGLDIAVSRINAEVDLFCAEYARTNQNNKEKKSAGNQVTHIGTVHGVVGNITNSEVTLYDYSSVNQLLIDHKIPKQDRRELEDIMDELKGAPPEKKPSLIARGEQWIAKHKELLGAAGEAVGNTFAALAAGARNGFQSPGRGA